MTPALITLIIQEALPFILAEAKNLRNLKGLELEAAKAVLAAKVANNIEPKVDAHLQEILKSLVKGNV